MKRLIFLFVPTILLVVIIILLFVFISRLNQGKGALQITSNPESKVYLNDKYIGTTPLCKCEAKDMLTTGDYSLRLLPQDKNLSEYQEKITISSGVLTVVDRKFAQAGASEGSVISLSPLDDKKKTELVVVSFPQGSSVLLDTTDIGNTPLLYKNPTESDHNLKIQKDGYKEKNIRIRTPLGYKLTATVYLGIDAQTSTTPQASASPSATLAPVQTQKVVILTTPTGFLRVRQSNSIGAQEVGRVSPGQMFDLLNEQDGWYKIKLPSGESGWISSQYAQKQ